MKSWPTVKNSGMLEQMFDDRHENAYWSGIFDQMYKDPGVIDTWDYQWIYACWLQGGLCIAPNKNLISNIGFNRPDAVHTKEDNPRSNLPTSEMVTMKHPECVMRHEMADWHSFDHIFGGRELRENGFAPSD
jgi:hypothetical protein